VTGPRPGARRYSVRHRTEYTYDDDVKVSYGWMYQTPRDRTDQVEHADQVCRSTRVEITPTAGLVGSTIDLYGNRAGYFEVHEPHRRLVVTTTSVVDVDRPGADLGALDAWTWEEARDLVRARPRPGREEVDFRLPSPRLPLSGPSARRLGDFTDAVLRPGARLGETLNGLVHTIHRDFAFRSGATTVSSTLDDLLERRAGVCQDFAHLAVATLRRAGFPARYVSGYLETFPPPGRPKLVGADASHAWVSVLVPDLGWVDLDPTNDKVVDSAYVVTAWGRDYSDVPPLKGVIFTEGGSSRLKVAVDVTRLD
jgi:transglutaminase-like putative cysteine protease